MDFSINFSASKLTCSFLFILISRLCFINPISAQNTDTSQLHLMEDSLSSVWVTAFQSRIRWQSSPVAVSILDSSRLQLLGGSSFVPVLNTVPGVRMEERSPGSYRLSIRGSLLHSPFGVRNIKVYWNDIPLSDAGGNTYFQSLDLNQVSSIEIIKGPASSMYGANTAGAVIIHGNGSELDNKPHIKAGVSGGSFGYFNQHLDFNFSSRNKAFQSSLREVHQQSDGDRQHTAMHKNVISWDGEWQIAPKLTMNFISFYSNLFYQTPGGVTYGWWQHDTTAYPFSVAQKASVLNNTFLAGVSVQYTINSHFDNSTSLMTSHTYFKNPFTADFEQRFENNLGGRTSFAFHAQTNHLTFKWLVGTEWLGNHSLINDYGNRAGVKDTVQFKDEMYSYQYALFTQANLEMFKNWTIQLGLSSNQQLVRYKRISDPAQNKFVSTTSKQLLAPRISILHKIIKNMGIYATVSKGFSPPSLSELHPSNGSFNDSVQPEHGWNYELGIKGLIQQARIQFDIAAYDFQLDDAIVKRSTATVDEFYVNAGSTKQAGFEAWVKWGIISNKSRQITELNISHSFSYQPYRFIHYQVANSNYDNHYLTGVPKNINVSTLELKTKAGIYINSILNMVSSLALNDANSYFATGYQLLQLKLGYSFLCHKTHYNLYTGVDNLLNQKYSLGNDINAFGNRYYNPAPSRNYYMGVELTF